MEGTEGYTPPLAMRRLMIILIVFSSNGLHARLPFMDRLQLTPRQAGFPKFPMASSEPELSCGKREVFHQPTRKIPRPPASRVVGGFSSPYGAYPWQVEIERYDSSFGFKHLCGGGIVSEFFVITAAHCFMGHSRHDFRIKVGDHSLEKRDQHEQMFEIEDWRIHPNFMQNGPFSNDIAVVKLKPQRGSGIQMGSHVSAACIPSIYTSYSPGTWCFVSGWGLTDHEVCRRQEVYGTRKLEAGMMCAGYLQGTIDACNGDSGSPLVCEIEGRQTLLGIVSWGNGCAKANKPGIYSNVKYYLDWILQSMEEM